MQNGIAGFLIEDIINLGRPNGLYEGPNALGQRPGTVGRERRTGTFSIDRSTGNCALCSEPLYFKRGSPGHQPGQAEEKCSLQ